MGLTNDAQPVPDIQTAVEGGISPGKAYVVDSQGGNRAPVFPGGEEAVLTTPGDRLEVQTTTDYNGTVSADGTYLAPSDYGGLQRYDGAKMRRYRRRDSLRKWLSLRGVALWAPVVLGLILAAIPVIALRADQDETTPGAVGDRARTAMQWVVEPLAQLPQDSDPAMVAAARKDVEARRADAARCLEQLGGADVPDATVPNVSCKPEKATGLFTEDNQAWISGVIGLLVAALAFVGTRGKFGFQESPA